MKAAPAPGFLPYLPGGLAIDVEVLDGEGELTIDIAVPDVVLCEHLCGKIPGKIVPRPVQRISAIIGARAEKERLFLLMIESVEIASGEVIWRLDRPGAARSGSLWYQYR